MRVPAVQGRIRQAGGQKVGYVQLAGFSEGAHDELRDEIETLTGRSLDDHDDRFLFELSIRLRRMRPS